MVVIERDATAAWEIAKSYFSENELTLEGHEPVNQGLHVLVTTEQRPL